MTSDDRSASETNSESAPTNSGNPNSGNPNSGNKVLTLPNAITISRLALLPVAIYLAVGRRQYVASTLLIAFIGSTDFLDGYLARRLNQVSELGKIIDPSADRIVILTIGVTAFIQGWIPWYLAAIVLFREIAISLLTSFVFSRYKYRIDVIFAGKAGTLALLFALPGIILGQSKSPNLHLVADIAIALTVFGIAILYYAGYWYLFKVLIPLLKGVDPKAISKK